MTDFHAMGRDNADEALDQAASHESITDAIEAYADNVRDTVMEKGGNEDDYVAAVRGFMAVLAAKGITHVPHGFFTK